MKSRIVISIIFAALLVLAAVIVAGENGTNLFKDLKLLNTIVNEVYENYVDRIDTHKLILSGIDGLLGGLDPHTVYFVPEEYENLKTSTRGEFGGLGIIIGVRDKILTVISPMEGTPAYRIGLQAGDKIVAIDGGPTKGMTSEDAVNVLRGEPGTKVTLTIVRVGEPEPIDYTITRDIIHIDAVPYAGMSEDSIGYIRLSRFSDDAGREVRAAVDSLKNEGMKGLIFDLRSNPGGLLSQAVEVASVFLESGDLVVYTQGKNESQYREYNTRWGSEYTNGPLVVLVNGGSASASEIVAGAIQDHDRGIIIGKRTFGKGLVQSVIPLTADGDALKITTAKYYIPSGRCIQKEYYLDRPESVVLSPENDEEESDEKESAEVGERWWEEDLNPYGDMDTDSIPEDAPVFYTENGRIVYGGGGITPDLFYEEERLSRLLVELERTTMFFSFAIDFTVDNPRIPPDFTVDEGLFNDFMDYLDEKEFSYINLAETRLAELESTATELHYGNGVTDEINKLREAIEEEKEKDFERYREYIERALRREIVTKLWGEDATYEYVTLDTDKVIGRAMELIRDDDEYYEFLESSDDR